MSNKAKILLVDDDEGLLQLLKMRISSVGYIVDTAESGASCLQKIDIFEPDLLISDLRMDEIDGMTLFEEVRQRRPYLPVIIISAHGTIPEAVEATQKGVFSFLPKPIEKETLFKVIEKALPQSGKENGQSPKAWASEILPQSPVMQEVLKKAKLVAQSESHVLIRGDAGTGKDILAKALHAGSRRNYGPFISVSCSHQDEEALNLELFGDGTRDNRGALALAKGGSIFIKEIDMLPSAIHGKLSRVLDDRGFRANGSSGHQANLDVRVISATRQDLAREGQDGAFREDLYYLINVISIGLPALSERREDISILAKHFLQKIASRNRPRVKTFSPKALELICQANWPGNIRQLYTVIEKLVVLATSSVISEGSVRDQLIPDDVKPQPSLADAKSEFERQYLIQVLKQAKGNVSQAARAAKRNRTDFYKLMARHNLQPGQFKISSVGSQ